MTTFALALCLAAAAGTPEALLAQHDLLWEVAATRWLDGIPMANGDIGALAWGDGNPLKITLDKYDAWDTYEHELTDATYADLRRFVDEGRRQEAEDLLACWRIYTEGREPTRLPLPRVEISFDKPFVWQTGRLNLTNATTRIRGTVDGEPVQLDLFVDTNRNVLVLEFEGAPAHSAHAIARWDHLGEGTRDRLRRSGFPDPTIVSDDSGGSLHMKADSGYELALAWTIRDADPSQRDVCFALLSNADADDPMSAAGDLCRHEVTTLDAARAEHAAWWRAYRDRSWLTIPDARLEALYYAEIYKLGCLSRPGKLPITLQGLWTQDGGMPPWSGDYHLDMNVQQSYWPIYAANRLELGEPLYRTFFECVPRWRKQCQDFFGFDGIWSGCAIGPKGERVFGYGTVEFWPGNAAWLAHHYWLHYRYSQDEAFLRDHALPFMELAFLTYANLLEPGDDGKLHLPLSYSPEYYEGRFDGYCSDPNGDLALIRFLTRAIIRSHAVLGTSGPTLERAQEVEANLVPFLREEPRRETRINERNYDDRLLISAGQRLDRSHRHHSHLMAIHPLGLLTLDGTEEEQALIRGSLHEISRYGTGEWTGWSYPWMSLIASRAGYGNMAWQMLDLYANAFIAPNTFHVNGDPRRYGLSMWNYEPMTLEAGLGAAAAIMEMLLQSHNECIRLFPSIPIRWHDAYFENLRAEGAFVVTAKLEDDQVLFVRILSEAGRACRVRNPFPGDETELVRLSSESTANVREPAQLSGDILEFDTEPGAVYLLYPPETQPSPEQMAPPTFPRTDLDTNFFGVKRRARF